MSDEYMAKQLYEQENILIQANINKIENKAAALENQTVITENALLSENAQAENILALRVKVGDVISANML